MGGFVSKEILNSVYQNGSPCQCRIEDLCRLLRNFVGTFIVNPPIVNIHSGMKARASMVLMKVMVMDMLMSPFRSRVQKLDPVPPGLQPRTNKPNLKIYTYNHIIWLEF